MGKKCIIEIENDRNIIETFDGKCTLAVSARLGNTEVFIDTNIPVVPYTAPDLDAIKQEEYEKGYKTAKVQCNIQAEKDLREVGERHYQKGLSDAWEAARKICTNWVLPDSVLSEIFGMDKTIDDIMKETTASEAIEKIRQHEQEKEEQIQVGDEVINQNKTAVVTEITNRYTRIMYSDGSGYALFAKGLTKTDRHFPEIAAVLEKMKKS